jgi:hypothetical protein
MELSTIRSLNVIGSILFGIFGGLIAVYIGFWFSFLLWIPTGSGGPEFETFTFICLTMLLLYVFLIVFLAITLYRNTVKALDEGDFVRAKRWSLYGAILGMIFGGGLITFILFILAYVFFDEALAPKYYYPYPYPPPGYYPPPPDDYHRRYKKEKEP